MIRILFVVMFAAILSRWTKHWRRVVGVTLVATLTVGMIFPGPAHAQLGGIESILNIINGQIRGALNAIQGVGQSLQVLYQQIVWPIELIDRARNSIASLIAQFRGPLQSIFRTATNSATLPDPISLETIIRNRKTNDFPSLSESYYRAFGTLPTADQADPLARKMIDIDDGLALNTLKILKATDQAGDLILDSGNRIEDEAQHAAPGSAPFLTAAAMAANIQSQAMMQKMLAAMLRQEAARIAHENTLRKRHAVLAATVRQNLSDALRRR